MTSTTLEYKDTIGYSIYPVLVSLVFGVCFSCAAQLDISTPPKPTPIVTPNHVIYDEYDCYRYECWPEQT